ncbi:MAG: hypothetical protein OXD31_04560 [Chloroflexi bacterium]|nr:hypothetical protein [Chloroflexota bacterium]
MAEDQAAGSYPVRQEWSRSTGSAQVEISQFGQFSIINQVGEQRNASLQLVVYE